MKNSLKNLKTWLLVIALALTANSAANAAVGYSVSGTNPFPSLQFGVRIVYGDFNNDGKIDMLYQAGNTAATGISVQLGNGDGTFQAAINQAAGGIFSAGPFAGFGFGNIVAASTIFVVDLDGDGKVDVVDDEGGSTTPVVLHNNGAGFTR